MIKIKHILSLGAGVNSTALLLRLIHSDSPLDEVIFADTKCELPETYANVNLIQILCKEKNINMVIVQNGDLYDHCLSNHIIPSRMFRWCTDKFKIKPMMKHLKNTEVKCYMGISFDEAHRARASTLPNVENLFPLIDQKIDRDGCKEILKNACWPPVLKSGCYFCPFQSLKGWQYLYVNYPRKFRAAELLEHNNSRYPEITFLSSPLSTHKKFVNNLLDNYSYPPKCDSGYCMT